MRWVLERQGLEYFATIFTPQGDGNAQILQLPRLRIPPSLRYLPRKGTETRNSDRYTLQRLDRASLRYLPRKGTETHSCERKSSVSPLPPSLRYLPRKGTETLEFLPQAF